MIWEFKRMVSDLGEISVRYFSWKIQEKFRHGRLKFIYDGICDLGSGENELHSVCKHDSPGDGGWHGEIVPT